MLAKLKELGVTKPINSDVSSGTHFHGDEILATPKMLLELFGKPQHFENTGMDKVNFDWTLLIDGEAFTIYDWKEYKPLDPDEQISWHIGAHKKEVSIAAKNLIQSLFVPLLDSGVVMSILDKDGEKIKDIY